MSEPAFFVLVEMVGYVGAFMTTAAFFPQTWKVIKTRDTRSISLAMYVLFTLGVCFWLVYGILIGSIPVIIANVITVVLSATILLMKLSEPKSQDIDGV